MEVLLLLPPLDASSLAATMAMMARTHTGLENCADGGAYGSLCAALGSGAPKRDASGTWDVSAVAKAVQQVREITLTQGTHGIAHA